MSVKLGPIALTFATDVRRDEVDEDAGRVRLSTNAREVRGRGSARATIESTLAAVESGTAVVVVTDLQLSGSVAQYGRGIVEDVTSQLVAKFADCLRAQLGNDAGPAGEAPVAPSAPPVLGLRLVLGAMLRRLGRLFRRSGGASTGAPD